MKQFLEEKREQLFEGELTLRKSDFWLVAAILFLLGVLYGLLKAPLTHGVQIACGNDYRKNTRTEPDYDCDCCECAQCCECDDEEYEG